MIKKGWLILGLVLLLAGCANLREELFPPIKTHEEEFSVNPKMTVEFVKQNITYGQTTKEDIKKVFGSPKSTSTSGDQSEIWTYIFDEITRSDYKAEMYYAMVAHAPFRHQTILIIFFDKNGVVTLYSATRNYQ